MSLIVSRSSPFFGFVSASNDLRWISISLGTSRGCGRREKFLRVTGAAADLANWATPQMVVGVRIRRGDSGSKELNGARRTKIPHACRLVQAWRVPELWSGGYLSSTAPP